MQLHCHPPRAFAAGPLVRGLLCAALGFAVAEAQNLPPETTGDLPEEREVGFLESDLLRDGSILKGVTLPSYNRALKLTSVVRADELVIVNEERINAKNLLIEMFDDKGVPDARIAMKKARFLPSRKMLISDQPVSIASSKLTANGSALVFDTEKTRGFLRGPVKAVTELDLQTSMNAKPARNAFAAGALLMAAATPLPAQQQPPKEPTAAERFAELRLKPEELEQIAAEAASKKDQLLGAKNAAEESIKLAKYQSDEARTTMNDFFRAAALTTLLAEPAPDTGDVPLPTLEEDPLKTVITSKEGAYFDSSAGLAIFLKEVAVKNPEFQLKGADELKIFMDPQVAEDDRAKAKAAGSPEGKARPNQAEGAGLKPKAEGAEEIEITPEMAEKMRAAKAAAEKLGKDKQGGDFGAAKRLVATGVVEIFYQSTEKNAEGKAEEPLLASARTVIYDLEKEQIILRGGSPWIVREGKLTRVNGNDAYILIFTEKGQPTKFVTGNQESFQTEFATPPKEEDKKGQKGPKNQKPQNPKNR